ncbi:DNA (cytosine-5-)-methyltransferase [Bradyrhizobium manausense]|uniref:DNA cytosine methyltransferase n=1 Tax=Bradyrhizobium manausense TaxID=989370 RepID=UPI001BA74A54|nr:DNA (cytosine-5-)-methyltransferase [Bradyrhizobium manausense]MBR0689895.1 DNA (cytosine-5-)-methyltransferase [Bradyrhizobium manausense]
MPQFDITAIFGGIGGLELGLHKAGHRTSLFCECDPEAVTVLRQQFPSIPVALDVRRTDELIERIARKSNLLTAGFPCTDLSQAGATRGFLGGRSSLIRETIELLRRRPFANVLIENVPNWRHLHGGEYLREVLSALEGLGYRWAYRTIDARAFGLPQRRLRIFLFATMKDDPRNVLFHGDIVPEDRAIPLNEAAHGFYWTEGTRGLGWGEDCVPTLKGGSAIGIPAPPAILMPTMEIVTPDLVDGERLQGFPSAWTEFEERDPVAGGGRFNRRRRWMLIGNAVNVEVSTWIGKRLRDRKVYSGDPGTVLSPGDSWPAVAWFDGKVRRRVDLGTWPVDRKRKPLADFLSKPGAPLSVRATAGFYKRIKASSLSRKPGFVEAVERHLRRMECQAGERKVKDLVLTKAA